MALTDSAVRSAKPEAKRRKLFDGRGLYLEVTPTGSKRWRLKYRFAGKEKLMSLGVYPDVSLKDARDKRDRARSILASGTDPMEQRKAEQASRSGANRFEVIGREWLEMRRRELAESTYTKTLWMLEAFVFPTLGKMQAQEITAPMLLMELRKLEARGKHETAHRVKQTCGRIFRYAIATGRAERDPSADLRGALAPVVSEHRATITRPAQMGELLRAIDGYTGQFTTLCALRLAPLVFTRPGELRAAEWDEIDLGAAEWRIPAGRMKMRAEHIVPLSRQAKSILEELQPFTGNGRYVFPGVRTSSRPMSENTVNAALRRMGYTKDDMTGHGFRSMASTRLNEMGWNPDLIERQLAHAERNKVRAAYNRAEYLAERRKMMQAWADYLDALREGAEIVPIHQKRQQAP